MLNFSKISKVSFCLVASTFLFTGNSGFSAEVLKLCHLKPHSFESHTAQMAVVFKNLVEIQSRGELRVEIDSSANRMNEGEFMEQVKRGEAQSYIASVYGFRPLYSLYDVMNLPFAYSTYAVAYDVFDGWFGVEMAEDIKKKTGFRVLGFGDYDGFFHITNSKRPIRSPEDIKGLKIRTMNIPLHVEAIRALGAEPVLTPWSELYTALQGGSVDGQMNPIDSILIAKLYEVQKYMTLSNHLYSSYVWVINDDWYRKLSSKLQEIVVVSAKTAIVAGRGIIRATQATEKGLSFIAEKMEIYSPTVGELARYRKMTIPAARKLVEDRHGEEGAKWVDKFLRAIDEAESKSKRLTK